MTPRQSQFILTDYVNHLHDKVWDGRNVLMVKVRRSSDMAVFYRICTFYGILPYSRYKSL